MSDQWPIQSQHIYLSGNHVSVHLPDAQPCRLARMHARANHMRACMHVGTSSCTVMLAVALLHYTQRNQCYLIMHDSASVFWNGDLNFSLAMALADYGAMSARCVTSRDGWPPVSCMYQLTWIYHCGNPDPVVKHCLHLALPALCVSLHEGVDLITLL